MINIKIYRISIYQIIYIIKSFIILIFHRTHVNITKVVLPPFTKTIDGLASNLNVIIPLVAGYATAYKGWQIVGTITNLLTAHTVALTTEKVAEDAAAISAGTATVAYSTKSVVVGALTGKVELATAAQWLWNVAMNANPVGLIVTGVAALAGGLATLYLCTNDATESNEKYNKSNQEIADSLEGVVSSAENFHKGISDSKGILDDFNTSIIVPDEKRQELADAMDNIQKEINIIAQTASDERRELTEAEIHELEDLFQKMNEISQQELEIQQAYQNAAKIAAQDLRNNGTMSLQEYENNSQKILKTAQDTKDKVIEQAESQYYEQLVLAEKTYGENGKINKKAYDEAVENARKTKENAINSAKSTYEETAQIIADGYTSRATAMTKGLNEIDNIRKENKKSQKRYSDELLRIEQDYNDNKFSKLKEYLDKGYTEISAMHKVKEDKENEQNAALEKCEKEHQENMNKIIKIATDEKFKKQLGVYSELLIEESRYGGKMSQISQQNADRIINIWESGGSETKEAGKNLFQGLIDGMKEEEPNVYDEATKVSNGFLSKIKSIFGIQSPSKVMRKLFRFVWQGAEISTEAEGKNLTEQAENVAQEFITQAKSKLETANLMAKMKATVIAEKMNSALTMTSNIVHSLVNSSEEKSNNKVVLKGNIQTSLNLDGREMGIALTPYLSEEIAFNNL